MHVLIERMTAEHEPLLRSSMPELDSVRGLAVLMVVTYHALFWSANAGSLHGIGRLIVLGTEGGWLGVQLFFVLSGFLITGILLDTRGNRDYYRRFLVRRALRILPAYLVLLLVLALLRIAGGPFLLASLLFVSNLTPILGIPMQYFSLWSLAVEEQFYLFWPLTVRSLSRRSLALVAILIVILTPALRYISFQHGWGGGLYWYTWFVSDGLALGALLALFLRSARATRKTVLGLALGLVSVGVLTIVIGLPFGILHRTSPLGAALQIAPWNFIFAGLIVLALLVGTSAWKGLITLRWLRHLGRISYGLYLLHLLMFTLFDRFVWRRWPALSEPLHGTISGLLFRLALIGGLSVLIASLSREYFEGFFLRLRGRVPAAE